jgi:hypothetical protein
MWLAVTAGVITAGAAHGQILFSENFNGLTLGPSVNERLGKAHVVRRAADFGSSVAIPNAFSHTGPAGWSVDSTTYNAYGASIGNSGVPLLGDPNYGVDEWEGWSFTTPSFWTSADTQGREQFALGTGVIAVADADEWDDLTRDATGATIPRQGFYNTEMKTGNINVAAHQGQTLTLKFDSSWDAECCDDEYLSPANPNTGKNNQSVVIAASFDGAPAINDTFLTFWDSNPTLPDTSPNPFFKGTAYNETLMYSLPVPAGATNVQLKFGYYNAANDWWWAVDNLSLRDAGSTTVWSENFDTVPLGPSVNEREQIDKVTAVNTDPATNPRPNSFTHTTPPGWSIDNSGINPAAIGDNNIGVFEWEGWSFADRDFWLFSAQGDAASFTKASGPFAIADSDEFDDLGGGGGSPTRPMSTALKTPTFDITGITAGTMMLAFDSSWRPEGTAQSAEITVDYGSGPLVVLRFLRWDSDPASPNQHGTNASGAPNLNESVLIPLNNPAGATSASLTFKYLNGSNNWFWAVDNIVVTGVPEPGTALLSILAMVGFTLVRARRQS